MDDGRRSKATRRRSRLLSRGPGSHNGELHRRGGARCPVKWITVCGGCGPKAFDGGLLLGGESSVDEVGSVGWLLCVCGRRQRDGSWKSGRQSRRRATFG